MQLPQNAMIKLPILVLLTVCCSTTYAVLCDHTTPVCICGEDEEVCTFKMDIDMLHTFTRYQLEKDINNDEDSRGVAGRVWYIDEGGNETAFNDTNNSVCNNINDNCTEAFYVDGRTFRSFIGINSRIPGPTLIVYQGQEIQVTVNNRLASESISIHWHGMHQRNNNWMDGVEHVTQCGILPGGSFTYTFTANESGTHWYHSHSGAQRTDGLFGALVVRENAEHIARVKGLIGESFEDNPENHTLTLWDWQNSNSIDLFTKIHSGIRHFELENGEDFTGENLDIIPQPRTFSTDDAEVGPVPYWSGLINGKGRYRSVDYNRTRLSIFTVSPQTTYRFRLIGAQSLYAFRVSVDGHKLRLIATDGVFVQPQVVDYIIVHSGERYDFLLETKLQEELVDMQDFIIRGETLRRDIPNNNYTEAILHYDTGTNSDTNSEPESTGYSEIAIKSADITETRCEGSSPCVAVNCPFKNYPPDRNINCINIHQLQLLEPFNGDLPDVNVDEESKLFFNFNFDGFSETSAINGRNLKLPPLPLIQEEPTEPDRCDLTDTISEECGENFLPIVPKACYCTHIRGIDNNAYIQLVLSAVGPDPDTTRSFRFAHPVHLHGHYFHVVDVKYGEYNENMELVRGNDDINCGSTELCTNPTWKPSRDYATGRTGKISSRAPLKDTVMVPYGGYVVVYFKADNPGYWFLHCHIEVHQLEGMGVVIREGERSTHLRPPSDFPACGGYSWADEEENNLVDDIYLIPLAFAAGLLLGLIICCIGILCKHWCCKE